jgi:hypothetical protein
MRKFSTIKQIDPFLMEIEFEDTPNVLYHAVIWNGNNMYSVRTIAAEMVEDLVEKTPTGRVNVHFDNLEIGDMFARLKNESTVAYDFRKRFPDNSGTPLLHIKNPVKA